MAPRVGKGPTRGKDTSSEKGSSKRDRVDRRRRDRTAAGKATAGKAAAAGKPAASRTARGRKRIDKSRTKGGVGKATQEKLKGWLATPADWARFNAWAEINAKPKKLPEPEPIVRPSKPLSQFKKRLKFLSEPRKAVDPSINCKLDQSISKAALNAVPSIRTNLLALPIVKLVDYGRVYYQVSPAALTYVASKRIIQLSQRCPPVPEECQPPRIRMCQPRPDEDRLKMLAMKRKLLHCPEQLTQEEIEELFTPLGTRRTALLYQITPWVEFLALPAYKSIKERRDEPAVTWKKMIIKEGEKRGKDAFLEYKKRRAKELEKERRMRMLRRKLCEEEEEKKKREKEEEAERRRRERVCGGQVMMMYEPKRKDCKDEEKRTDKKTLKRKRETRDNGDAKKVARREKAEEKVSKEDEERKKKQRKKKKHAWRFAPYPCKYDPYLINKTTLEFEATPRLGELSQPRIRKCKTIKANPFGVKKAALSASASGRVENLAKPMRPRSPVEKKPPREKDAYGRPIFIIPVYGKVLPKTKPYKMGKCPTEEEKKKKKKVAKKRPIDPIVYEPSYDPCIYPDLAKRQKMERKRAAKLSPKKKGKRRRTWAKQASKTTVAEDENKEVELEERNINREEEQEKTEEE